MRRTCWLDRWQFRLQHCRVTSMTRLRWFQAITVQLLTVFDPCCGAAFPVINAPKTCALYREVCSDAWSRPGVCLWTDFGRRPLLLFRIRQYHSLSGCWFHHHRLCRSAWRNLASKKITRIATTSRTLFAASCMGQPLLPAADIPTGVQEIRGTICNDWRWRFCNCLASSDGWRINLLVFLLRHFNIFDIVLHRVDSDYFTTKQRRKAPLQGARITLLYPRP